MQPGQTVAVPASLLLPSFASPASLPLPLSAWPEGPTGLLWRSPQCPCLRRIMTEADDSSSSRRVQRYDRSLDSGYVGPSSLF